MKLIVGSGYLGLRVAAAWRNAGEEVVLLTRSAERAREFTAAGYRGLVADVTDRASLASLPRVESMLYAVGFDRTAGKPMREVYVAGLRNMLDALPATGTLQRWIYISTTGVYGSADGLVTEASECHPTREGGQVCLDAEQQLREHPLGGKCVILRLAGIYGPGRVPNRQALLEGKPIVAAPESRLNLIHVDDAVRAVLAAENCCQPPELYLVSDGNPPLRREYYAEVAHQLGVEPPRLVEPSSVEVSTGAAHASSRSARAHDASAKVISNRKMLEALGVTLQFPTYREGLRQAFAAGD